MKKMMLRLLAVAAFVASVSVSCSEISFIEINPPADLQSKIDSIAQAKKDQMTGDKEDLTIATALVGAFLAPDSRYRAGRLAHDYPIGGRVPVGRILLYVLCVNVKLGHL